MGFKVNELFLKNSSGVQTDRDTLFIDSNKENLVKKIKKLLSNELDNNFVNEYNVKNSSGFNLLQRIVNATFDANKIMKINYRPFDLLNIYYDEKLIIRAGYESNRNLLNSNIALIVKRGFDEDNAAPAFITKFISDRRFWTRPGMQGAESIFPLYLYPENKSETELADNQKSLEAKLEEAKMHAENFEKIFPQMQKMYNALPNPTEDLTKYYKEQEKHLQKLEAKVELFKQQLLATTSQNLFEEEKRRPNLNTEIVAQIAKKLGLTFTNEKEASKDTFAPIDLLDYIYVVLHSPTYREKYKEFLKIDFPRVPYPKDVTTFWHLVKLGGQIRQIHLLESPTVENYITQYPINGDNVVSKVKYFEGKVYINDTQYFDNVPQIAWEFYIGGYQPAQKWLKDRKDRKLDFDDIFHYQKIIVALVETYRLMKEIDGIEIE
jgi:predicted helicase